MPHENRPLMKRQPVYTFDQVFDFLSSQPQKTVTGLITSGGVSFSAQAKISPKVGKYISLPHNNRIYYCCWGNTNNHMGKEGQRISQYTRAIDEWCLGFPR